MSVRRRGQMQVSISVTSCSNLLARPWRAYSELLKIRMDHVNVDSVLAFPIRLLRIWQVAKCYWPGRLDAILVGEYHDGAPSFVAAERRSRACRVFEHPAGSPCLHQPSVHERARIPPPAKKRRFLWRFLWRRSRVDRISTKIGMTSPFSQV